MTRREALLATFGIPMGQFDALKPGPGISLRVPLDQWHAVTFQYRGKEVRIPVAEIFAAIAAKGE